MWRNKKVILTAMVAGILLAGGIGGAAVYAKTGNIPTVNAVLNQAANVTSGNDTLMTRVAKILGIDQQKLQDAFTQARGDMQNERLDKYLANLITQGKITQAQADNFKTWWQSRPTSNQTTFQEYRDWMQARPADVPLPRRIVGSGSCGGPFRGAGPARGGMAAGPGMMGRF